VLGRATWSRSAAVIALFILGSLLSALPADASESVIQVVTAANHSCALTSAGGVKCWGANANGELGDGTTTDRLTPVAVSGLQSGVVSISVGLGDTCAVTAAGGAKCWGYNALGQLGDGTTTDRSTPVDVLGLQGTVAAIAPAQRHTCALMDAGSVKCWGSGLLLGDGTNHSSLTPVDVSDLQSGVTAISAVYDHTCALTNAGSVKCWGFNANGELGDGSTTNRTSPVDVSGLASGVVAISAGWGDTCAVTSGGAVKCWGFNANGELGDGTTTSSPTPVDVSGLQSGVVDVSAGSGHSCALTSAGAVSCWGHNGSGELGDGSTTSSLIPVDVSDLQSGVNDVSAGFASCAATDIGAALCWGYNGFGQVGDGTTADRLTPVDVVGLEGGAAPGPPLSVNASAGHGQATISWSAPSSDGGSPITGYTVTASPGGATTTVDGSTTTATITGLVNGTGYAFTVVATNAIGDSPPSAGSDLVTPRASAPQVSGGGIHTCALTPAGGVRCWGYNFYGELGDGTNTDRHAPVSVVGLGSDVVQVSAGDHYTCALLDTGGVQCWGYNFGGELGDGTTNPSSTPVDVVGLSSGVTAIDAGKQHTCALTVTGSVLCWGYNHEGELGNGTTDDSATPVQVTGLSSGARQIATGWVHNCALMASGAVRCWGYNAQGELGDGTTTDSTTPVAVLGLAHDVSSLSIGTGRQTCALETNGGVQCWGANFSGELGNGTTTQSSNPVDVVGLTSGVASVTAGENASCAVTTSGAAKCWGSGIFGGLGNNSSSDSSTPVNVSGLGSGVASISGGGGHACVVKTDTTLRCWGENFWGQVGDGSTNTAFTPVVVALFPPGPPTGASAVAGDAQATVSWSAPADDGGGPITRYTVTASPGGEQAIVGGSTHAATVTGLSNGTAYTFTVVARNSDGDGPASAPTAPVTPVASATAPDAPTGASASPGNARATVTWSAPGSDGGSQITSYTVTASPGGQTATVNGSTLSTDVTGLTNGTSYTFTVVATNALGNSPASAPSNAVTPRAVPTAPRNVSAVAGNAQATITWAAPLSNGGSAITGYTVTASPGGASVSVGGSTLTGTVTGLTNGTTYTFTVVATNVAGNGPASAPSGPVTPHAVVPGAPTNVVATPGNQQATVTWTAPSSDGGSQISSYTVTSSVGGFSVTVNGNVTTATVTGLTNGTSYRFQVAATNAVGTGPKSALSNTVVPRTVPGAPTNVAATAGNASATVSWTAPASNGGSAITGYTVTSSPGGLTRTVNGTTTSTSVTGLTNGTSYTFTVVATNAAGSSTPSAPSNAVTPRTVPGAPTNVVATAGNGQATVTWNPPASNGGSTITGYTVTSNVGASSVTVDGNTTTAVVTGLTNGTSYRFRVAATNVVGTGTPSAFSAAVVPAGLPAAPTGVTAIAGNASATVSWTAGSNGGSAITSYVATATPGGATVTVGGSARTAAFLGLANGTTYSFTVVAANSIGSSPPSPPSNAVTPSASIHPIVFASTRGSTGEDIWFMNPDGTGQVQLTSLAGTQTDPAISPDDTKVVFVNGSNTTAEISVVNIDGTGLTTLTSNAVNDQDPSWSPDGTRIVFRSQRDGNPEIYAMNANGTGQTRLTNNSGQDILPSWSPDGTRIAFSSNRVGGNFDIYVMDATGANVTRLTTATGSDQGPAWSPDGTQIAFDSTRDGNQEIYVMNADGTTQTRLTNDASGDSRPQWAPDATKIVWTTNRNGSSNYEIYTMNPDGTVVTRLTNQTGNDIAPDW
jgi:alpha-tubulin suppressor-like RCC1 family protein/Tol biopolymer transport system component